MTTLTLKDLLKADFPETSLAVLGSPIEHSLSPLLHQAAIGYLQETRAQLLHWHYYRFHITPEELKSALELFYQKAFKGLNITLPHKQTALKYIELQDSQVKATGALNTLYYTSDGYEAFNTDIKGFQYALKDTLKCNNLNNARCLIIGAGGSARSVLYALIQENAKTIYLYSRNKKRFPSIEKWAKRLKPSLDLELIETTDFPIQTYPEVDIVIHATPLGLEPENPLPLTPMNNCQASFMDLVYHPKQTPWVRLLRQQGRNAIDGLPMLVAQGLESLNVWSEEPSSSALFAYVNQYIRNTINQ